jgi:phosphoribosylanthranilate isomerase
VRPYGLDICNGVRRDGKLDAQRLRDFVRAARGAAASPAR